MVPDQILWRENYPWCVLEEGWKWGQCFSQVEVSCQRGGHKPSILDFQYAHLSNLFLHIAVYDSGFLHFATVGAKMYIRCLLTHSTDGWSLCFLFFSFLLSLSCIYSHCCFHLIYIYKTAILVISSLSLLLLFCVCVPFLRLFVLQTLYNLYEGHRFRAVQIQLQYIFWHIIL